MATSGSFNTSGYNGGGYPDHYTFSWSLVSQSISGNYSDISWKVVGAGGSTSGRYTNVKQKYVTVNGSTQSNDTVVQTKNGTVAFSGTTRIYHNSDGKKSFSASCGGAFYYYGSYNSQGSGSWDLPQIARASSVSGGSGNIGGTTTISIGRADASLTHTLKYSFGSLSGTIATGVGTSYNWTIPTSFYAQIPRANSGTGTITCETYSGNTKVGTSTCQFTAKVVDSNPTFVAGNISYQDTNSTITAITGNNQHIVRNLSNLKVTIQNATGKNSASISKYEITFNSVTKTLTSAGTVDFGTVNLSSNTNVSVKVTDSRGNTTTVTKTITILNWELPIATITARRVNNYEDETNLKVSVTISSVNSKNSIQSIRYRYKKSTASSYSDYITITNDKDYKITIDKLYLWDFQVEIKDKFGTKTYTFQVPKGMPIMMIDVDLISVGINCFPTKANSFFVNGYDFNNLHPVNSIIATTNNSNPSSNVTGTWELLTSTTINNNTIYYWKRTA